jgi:lipoprotein-releasing system permease protein
MHLELLLVRRAITRRFGRATVALVGVALAIAALVFLEATMEGVGDAMVRNSVALHHGHVLLCCEGEPLSPARAEALSGVRRALSRTTFSGTLAAGSRRVGLMVYGVDPAREAQETVIAGKVVSGAYLPHSGDILVGAALAEALGVCAGAEVALWQAGPAATPYRVCGVFRTGIELLDARTAYVRFEDAPGEQREMALFLAPAADATAVARDAEARLGPGVQAMPWQQSLAELVQLIALNHVAMNIVQLLALLIMAFGVSNTVFITVSERTREIGILKALGMTPAQVRRLILLEVLVLVTLAGVLGLAMGLALNAGFDACGLDLGRWTSQNPHFIGSGVVYPRTTVRSLALPLLVSVSCGLAAALLPATRAGRVAVVRALRSL